MSSPIAKALIICLIISLVLDILSFLLGGPDASLSALLRFIIQTKLMFLTGFAIGISRTYFRLLLGAMLVTFFISFVIAVGEHIFAGRVSDLLYLVFPIPDNDLARMMMVSGSKDGEFRATAFFDHAIVLGIASGMAIALALAEYSRSGLIGRCVAVALILAAIAGGYFSYTRTFYIAIVVTPVVYFALRYFSLFRGRNWGLLFAGLLALVAVGAAAATALAPNLNELIRGRTMVEALSSMHREVMWSKGMSYFEQSPLLGWGMGSDIVYGGIQQSAGSATIDDSYLSILLNGGIFSLVMLIVIACLALARAVEISIRGAPLSHYASAFGAIVVCVLACQKGNSIPAPFAYLYLVAGLLAARNIWEGNVGESTSLISLLAMRRRTQTKAVEARPV
jgi:O-antigen ligase